MKNSFGLSEYVVGNGWKELTIPSEKAESPWNEVMEYFNKFGLPSALMPQTREEANYLLIEVLRPWGIKLHWLYRLAFDERHKIPAKRKEITYYKPQGVVLNQLRELSKELHARGYGAEYGHAGVWFALAVSDQIHLQVDEYLADMRSTFPAYFVPSKETEVAKKPQNKKEAIAERRREFLNPLKEGEFPLSKIAPHNFKHWKLLIESALQEAGADDRYSERGNVFNKGYWEPYLQAESKVTTAMEQAPDAVRKWVENGKLYAQMGKGKGKVVLAKINQPLKPPP